MLQIKNLHVKIDDKSILKGLDLEIGEGEVHVVMGPNGSGKSTLAYTLAGHPKYEIENGEIKLDGSRINDDIANERADRGVFLANQYPVAIPGLTAQSFLWQIYKQRFAKDENNEGKKISSILEFRKWLEAMAKTLGLKEELLKRSLNDGFSGGEKKKMEILQMLVFNPKYIILDEIDSGLDVDALKKIANTVVKVSKERHAGVLVITHYSRFLDYLNPDKIHVMKDGKIIKSGDTGLVAEIEKEGYGLNGEEAA